MMTLKDQLRARAEHSTSERGERDFAREAIVCVGEDRGTKMSERDQLDMLQQYAEHEGTGKRFNYVCENQVLSKTAVHPVLAMVRGPDNHLEGITLWQPQVDTAAPGRVYLTWEDIDELVKLCTEHGHGYVRV